MANTIINNGATFVSELEGQAKFYEFLEKMGIFNTDDIDFSNHTDGVFGNVLIENKLEVENDYFKALSQCIKYAARFMWSGNRIPAYFVVSGLNDGIMYVFKSADFINEIENVEAIASASKNNETYYTTVKPIAVLSHDLKGFTELANYINSDTPSPKYNVSVKNVVGLSKVAHKNGMTKNQFLDEINGELRKPTILADRINAYTDPTNDAFKRIMDVLNTPLLQRELGAFYTPDVYVAKAQEMLMNIINNLPKGKNYVVIDRCAGTGNLEVGLSDEVLAHCILNTVEDKEFACLAADFGDKVLALVQSDALETAVITEAKPYVDDENTVVIMYENPPYSEVGAGVLQGEGLKKNNSWTKSLVYQAMGEFIHKKENAEVSKRVRGDLANLFIWSGFEYYMNGKNDAYVLFSPIKYWKGQNLVNKNFVEGYLVNRKAFHATASSIALISWGNKNETLESLTLDAIDLSGEVVKTITTKKAHIQPSTAYDNKYYEDDVEGLYGSADGNEVVITTQKKMNKAVYNENIIGFFQNGAFDIDPKNTGISTLTYFGRSGFSVRTTDYLRHTPLMVAARMPQKKWYEKAVYYKTLDKGEEYMNDAAFVRKCFLWVMLSPQTKIKSLKLSNGIKFSNKWAFEKGNFGYEEYYKLRSNNDEIDIDKMTKEELVEYFTKKETAVKIDTTQEDNLINTYNALIEKVKTDNNYGKAEYDKLVAEYGEGFTLGLWQVIADINIYKDPTATRKVKKYKTLDTAIKDFKKKLENFYTSELLDKCFEYELIK